MLGHDILMSCRLQNLLTNLKLGVVHRMGMKTKGGKATGIRAGEVAAGDLKQSLPAMALPIWPPFPPAEAKSVEEIPKGQEWPYEPKWDGFRCLAFRRGNRLFCNPSQGSPWAATFPN